MKKPLSYLTLFFLFAQIAIAQLGRARALIALAVDDTLAFAAAPSGFDKVQESINHGQLDSVYYPSKTVGNNRRMLVYTAPGILQTENTRCCICCMASVAMKKNG